MVNVRHHAGRMHLTDGGKDECVGHYPLFSRDLQLDLLLPHLLPLAVVPAEGSPLLLGLLLPGHLTEDVLIRIRLTATGNSVIIRS